MGIFSCYSRAVSTDCRPLSSVVITSVGAVMARSSSFNSVMKARDDDAPMQGRGSDLPISPYVHHSTCSRSEEHTSELQSLMRTSYAVFCLEKKTITTYIHNPQHTST